jgi:hypothetical protein
VVCLSDTAKNLACGVGRNLHCDGIEATVGSFAIAITAPGHLYSMWSCQPTSPEALPAPHVCCADSRVSVILIGPHPVKMRLPRRPGPGHLVGLETYGCQPHGGTRSQRPRGPDLGVESARGRLRSPHMGVVLAEVKLEDGAGPGPSACQVWSWFRGLAQSLVEDLVGY